MMKLSEKIHLQIEAKSDQEDERFILRALTAFNSQFAPPDQYQTLNVFARSSDQQIVGGLVGATYWGWLYINLLWLDEAYRGQGLGKQLIQTAETEAVQRGCKHAHVDTLDFQAPHFYEKLGYTRFGVLHDLPPGHRRIYYQKRLLSENDRDG